MLPKACSHGERLARKHVAAMFCQAPPSHRATRFYTHTHKAASHTCKMGKLHNEERYSTKDTTLTAMTADEGTVYRTGSFAGMCRSKHRASQHSKKCSVSVGRLFASSCLHLFVTVCVCVCFCPPVCACVLSKSGQLSDLSLQIFSHTQDNNK